MSIYLIKHPSTTRNRDNELTGWEDPEYSKDGKKQFEKIVNYFMNISREFTIWSSDLPRALKLAKRISREKGWTLKVSKLLREQNFKQTSPSKSFETKKDFRDRVKKFLKKNILDNHIVISHSGTTRIIIDNLMNDDLKHSIKFPRSIIFKIETIKNKKTFKRIQV